MTQARFELGVIIKGIADSSLQQTIAKTQAALAKGHAGIMGNATRLARTVGQQIDDTARTAKRRFDDVQKHPLWQSGAVLAGGLLTGIGVATYQAQQFEARMAQVYSRLLSLSEAQQSQMEATARQLAASSQFTATETAGAMQYLAQAGLSANEVLAATPGVLDLAAAGALDLSSAADIATNVLSGMGLEVDQLGRVTDVLTAQAARSNTSVADMGAAMSYAAPTAASLGISVETASGAIGALADAGIRGQRGGTALRAILLQLSKAADDGAISIGGQSVAVFDATGKFRDFADITTDLSTATADMSQEQRQAALSSIVTTEALGPLQVLLADGAASTRDYAAANREAAGSAKAMADMLTDNLQGDMLSLQSSLQELALAIGTELLPRLRPIVHWVTGIIDRTSEWVRANPNLVMSLVKVGAAVSALTVALPALAAATAILSGPGGWLVLAAGALTVLYDQSERFRLAVQALAEMVVSTVGKITAVVTPALGAMQSAAGWLWDRLPRQVSDSTDTTTAAAAEMGTAMGGMTALAAMAAGGIEAVAVSADAASVAMAATQVPLQGIRQQLHEAIGVARRMAGSMTDMAASIASVGRTLLALPGHGLNAAVDGLDRLGRLVGRHINKPLTEFKLIVLGIGAVLIKALGPTRALNVILGAAKLTVKGVSGALTGFNTVANLTTSIIRIMVEVVDKAAAVMGGLGARLQALLSPLASLGEVAGVAAGGLRRLVTGQQAATSASQQQEQSILSLTQAEMAASRAAIAMSRAAMVGVPLLATFGGEAGTVAAAVWTVAASLDSEAAAMAVARIATAGWTVATTAMSSVAASVAAALALLAGEITATTAAMRIGNAASNVWLATQALAVTTGEALQAVLAILVGEQRAAAIATSVATTATGAWTTATGAATTAMAALSAAIAANPIGAIAVAAAAAAAGLVVLYRHMDGFRTAVDGAAMAVRRFLSLLTDSGRAVMETLAHGVAGAGHLLVGAVQAVLHGIRMLLPFSDAAEGPLSTLTASGMAIPATLARGVRRGAQVLASAALGLVTAVADIITDPLTVDRLLRWAQDLPIQMAAAIRRGMFDVGQRWKSEAAEWLDLIPLASIRRSGAERAFDAGMTIVERLQFGIQEQTTSKQHELERIMDTSIRNLLPGGGIIATFQARAGRVADAWWSGVVHEWTAQGLQSQTTINRIRDEVLIDGIHRDLAHRMIGGTIIQLERWRVSVDGWWGGVRRSWGESLDITLGEALQRVADGLSGNAAAFLSVTSSIVKNTVEVAQNVLTWQNLTSAVDHVTGALHFLHSGLRLGINRLADLGSLVGLKINREFLVLKLGLLAVVGIMVRAIGPIDTLRLAINLMRGSIQATIKLVQGLNVAVRLISTTLRIAITIIREAWALGVGMVERLEQLTAPLRGIAQGLGAVAQGAWRVVQAVPGVGTVAGQTARRLQELAGAETAAAAAANHVNQAALIGVPILASFGGRWGGVAAAVWTVAAAMDAEAASAAVATVATTGLHAAQVVAASGATALATVQALLAGEITATTAAMRIGNAASNVWLATQALAVTTGEALQAVLAILVGEQRAAAIATSVATTATGAWTTATGAATTAMAALSAAIAANPIGAIAVAAAAAAAGLVVLYRHMDGFRTAVDGAAMAVRRFLSLLTDSGRAVMETLAHGVAGAGHLLVGAVQAVLHGIRMLLPFSDAAEGPLSTLTASGMAIPATLARGVRRGQSVLTAAMADMATAALSRFTRPRDWLSAGQAWLQREAHQLHRATSLAPQRRAVTGAVSGVAERVLTATPLRSAQRLGRQMAIDRSDAEQERLTGISTHSAGAQLTRFQALRVADVLPGVDAGPIAAWRRSLRLGVRTAMGGIADEMAAGGRQNQRLWNRFLFETTQITPWEKFIADTKVAMADMHAAMATRGRGAWISLQRVGNQSIAETTRQVRRGMTQMAGHVTQVLLAAVPDVRRAWTAVGDTAAAAWRRVQPILDRIRDGLHGISSGLRSVGTVVSGVGGVANTVLGPLSLGSATQADRVVGLRLVLLGLTAVVVRAIGPIHTLRLAGQALRLGLVGVRVAARGLVIAARVLTVAVRGVAAAVTVLRSPVVALPAAITVLSLSVGAVQAPAIAAAAGIQAFSTALLASPLTPVAIAAAALLALLVRLEARFGLLASAVRGAGQALANVLDLLRRFPLIGGAAAGAADLLRERLGSVSAGASRAGRGMRLLGQAAMVGVPLLGAMGGNLGMIASIAWTLVAATDAETLAKWRGIAATKARLVWDAIDNAEKRRQLVTSLTLTRATWGRAVATHADTAATIAGAVAAKAGALAQLALGGAMGVATGAATALAAALAANPLTWIAAAIVGTIAVVTLLARRFTWLGDGLRVVGTMALWLMAPVVSLWRLLARFGRTIGAVLLAPFRLWWRYVRFVFIGLPRLVAGAAKLMLGLWTLPFRLVLQMGRNLGVNLLRTIGASLKAGARYLLGPFRWVLGLMDRLIPHSDAQEGPLARLTDSGASIPLTMAAGLQRSAPALQAAMADALRLPVPELQQAVAVVGSTTGFQAAPGGASNRPGAGGGVSITVRQEINVTVHVGGGGAGRPSDVGRQVADALSGADRQAAATIRQSLADMGILDQ